MRIKFCKKGWIWICTALFGKAFTIGTKFSNSCEGRTQKIGREIEEPFMRMTEKSIRKL